MCNDTREIIMGQSGLQPCPKCSSGEKSSLDRIAEMGKELAELGLIVVTRAEYEGLKKANENLRKKLARE